MNIVMLHPHDVRYHPWTIRIIKLAESLEKMGHQTRIVYPRIKNEKGGLTSNVITKLREVRNDGHFIELYSRDKDIYRNLQKFMPLAQWADIIHLQKCFSSTALPALYGAYLHDKPIHYDWDDNERAILASTGHQHKVQWGFRRLTALYEGIMPGLVDSVSVASDGLGRLIGATGFSQDRTVKVPVGADLDLFSPAISGQRIRDEFALEDHPVAIYLGQLEGAAYVELYIQAAQKVWEQNQECRFLIVGGGGTLKSLMAWAQKFPVFPALVFTDYRPSNEVPEFLAAADVAVACFEDNEVTRCKSPLKVAEYLAAGKAIVASAVGDVPEMISKAGILVPPGSVDELAGGMLELLGDKNEQIKLSRLARQRAEDIYNWDQSARNLLEAYQKAIAFRKSL